MEVETTAVSEPSIEDGPGELMYRRPWQTPCRSSIEIATGESESESSAHPEITFCETTSTSPTSAFCVSFMLGLIESFHGCHPSAFTSVPLIPIKRAVNER